MPKHSNSSRSNNNSCSYSRATLEGVARFIFQRWNTKVSCFFSAIVCGICGQLILLQFGERHQTIYLFYKSFPYIDQPSVRIMRKIFPLLLSSLLPAVSSSAQILFQERFNGYTLNNNSAHITNYTNWNISNIAADTLVYKNTTPLPFGKTEYKNDAWVASKLPLTNDTVAMVAGYLQGAVYTPDKWLLLPPLSISQANVFLSWESKVAATTNFEAYQVLLATNNTANPTVADFTTTLYSTNMDTNFSYNNFVRRAVPLSAYNGQTVRIAFRYKNGTIAAANFCLYLDDIVVENVLTATDVAMKDFSMPKYVPKGNNTVSFTITNRGYTPVTSVEAGFRYDGNPEVSNTINISPALTYGQSAKLSLPGTVNIPNAGSSSFKVFLKKVNGANSPVPANDTAVKKQFVYDYKPVRRLLLENITGAWCSACPDVSHELHDLYKKMKDTVIVASVHDASTTYGDPMTIGLSYPLMTAYDGSSYPQVLWGRTPMMDRFPEYDDAWYLTPQAPSPSVARNYAQDFCPVDVSITGRSYNAATRQISFTVQAKFVTDDDGAYNLNCYLVEDSCWSTNYGWAQYNGGNGDPTSPYYGQGNPIPNYKHKHVVINVGDQAWGNATAIPATQTAGQVYSKQYTFTLPQPTANINRYNPDKIKIVAFVQGRGTTLGQKKIINASKELEIKPVGIASFADLVSAFSVYPNPASGTASVGLTLKRKADVHIEVSNALGQLVYELPAAGQTAGSQTYELPLQALKPGVYFVSLSADGERDVRKLIVQ